MPKWCAISCTTVIRTSSTTSSSVSPRILVVLGHVLDEHDHVVHERGELLAHAVKRLLDQLPRLAAGQRPLDQRRDQPGAYDGELAGTTRPGDDEQGCVDQPAYRRPPIAPTVEQRCVLELVRG